MLQVEREQRLVAEQQPRVVAIDAWPTRSAAAPRRTACPIRRVRVRASRRPRRSSCVDPPAAGPRRRSGEPQPVPVEAEADEVAGAQRRAAVEQPLLRDVADVAVAPATGAPSSSTVPRSSVCWPRIALSRLVLPGPLGPSTARNSPGPT